MSAPARVWVAVLAAVTAAACGGGPSPPPTNLVLISLDTLTPSRMSTYGLARETTPAISTVAAAGVRFTNAFSPSPWTLPAHAAMLTGLYPSSLAPDPNDRRLYHGAPLLAELFRARGYRTGAVTGGGFVSKRFGVDRGFEDFHWAGAPAAVKWIEAHAGTPFFLFFHSYLAHAPYNDRRYVSDGAGERLASIYTKTPGASGIHTQVCCTGLEPSAAEREFLLALYDGGVARADEAVGMLWTALERLDLLDRTAVVVTSDHGEEFWDHLGRAAYHGHSLYDELLRVPLVWYEPGLPRPGSVVDAPVSLIDIVPTVAARFGLDLARTDGLDLRPLLSHRRWDVERALFGEGVRHGPTRASVRTARGKLIETLDETQHGEGAWAPVAVLAPEELYLPDDRGERRNVVANHSRLAASLRASLDAHRRAGAASPPASTIGPLDEETRERLRVLGYTEP
jgi:arylsulfatase A-like enzyme